MRTILPQQEKLESQYHCRLNEDEFPFVKPPVHLAGSPQSGGSATHSSGNGGGFQGQQREVRAISSFRTKGGGTKDSKDFSATPTRSMAGRAMTGALRTDNQRVFVFFIGGFTYSELRLAHHMSETLNKDVFVGGTCLLTPASFIESLRGLSK